MFFSILLLYTEIKIIPSRSADVIAEAYKKIEDVPVTVNSYYYLHEHHAERQSL